MKDLRCPSCGGGLLAATIKWGEIVLIRCIGCDEVFSEEDALSEKGDDTHHVHTIVQ